MSKKGKGSLTSGVDAVTLEGRSNVYVNSLAQNQPDDQLYTLQKIFVPIKFRSGIKEGRFPVEFSYSSTPIIQNVNLEVTAVETRGVGEVHSDGKRLTVISPGSTPFPTGSTPLVNYAYNSPPDYFYGKPVFFCSLCTKEGCEAGALTLVPPPK